MLLNELELRHVETLTTTCALIVRWSASVIKAGVALKINHYFPTRCGRTISKNRIFILCTSAMETMYIKLGVIYRDLWTSSDLNFSHRRVTDMTSCERMQSSAYGKDLRWHIVWQKVVQ